jgi:hypothetical protein
MEHEDGYCDECGADMRGFAAQITLDGRQLCIGCLTPPLRVTTASKPEARDDGR